MANTSTHKEQPDLEKGPVSYQEDSVSLDEAYEGTQTPSKLSFFDKLGAALNAETKGIDRVLEHERDPKEGVLEAATMWFSANMVIAALALGMLGGGVFGLSFWESTLTIIFFNILDLVSVAFFSCFGPAFGFLGRFSYRK